MTEPDELASGDEQSPARAARSSARVGRRRLDRRTLAISVLVALIGALIAALVTASLLDDDTNDKGADRLALADQVDTDELLGVGLLTVDGQATELSALLGDKPLVVNLWAQNCVPCVDEMPLLEQARAANPDLDFLGVDTQDPNLDRAKRLVTQTGITYPWVRDPDGNFFFAARAAGLPTTFLITPDGEIVASRTKAFSSLSELQGWIDRSRP